MNGLHLIADLHDCRCPPGLLLDGPGLEAYCADACQRHGLTVVGRLFHAFRDAQGQPAGVTGTVVLAESHLAIHTWPEIGAVTLDVYVCNRSGDHSRQARQVLATLRAMLSPARVEEREIMRGALGRPPAGPPASPA